jgi:hypothetical protein
MKTILTLMLSCLISTLAWTQTLEEIVSKHIEAIGGKDNWAKIKTIKIEGTMKAQGLEIKISIFQVDKKAFRQNISVMGMTGYSIVTKTEGWNFMPFQGQTKPEPITADDLQNEQDQLNVQDDFITYKELGKSLEYLGTDDIDGVECFKLKMIDKNQKETTYYIDPDNYLILKQVNKVKANGQESENSIIYGNYKKLDEGIVYPMSKSSGMMEREIDKLEINSAIDDSEFKVSI